MARISYSYTAAGVLIVALAGLTAPDGRWSALPWLLSCSLGAAAIAVGMRTHRPLARSFWIALGATEVAWAVASLVPVVGGPTVASDGYDGSSAPYVAGYLFLAWATVAMLRRVGARRPETIDAAICAAVAAALMWPAVVAGTHANGRGSLINAAFPVWDLLLAMMLVRILFSGWFRKRSLRLLAAATLLLVGSDLLYFSGVFDGSTLAGRLLSMSYTASYLLLGAAALHPSMRRLPPRALPGDDGPRGRRRTLWVVGGALLLTPAIFGVDQIAEGNPRDAGLAAIGAVVVGLVVLRISRLLAHTDALRRRAEESERLFRMVFDAAGVGISVGADGMLTRTNPALQRMLGYSGDELAGMHFLEITHPADRHRTVVPTPGRVHTFEKRCLRKDGEPVWTEVTLTAPPDGGFGIAVLEDVSTAKRLESDLRHAQKMEAIGQLAGGIAHDFNNLMTAVIGYSGMLRQELTDADPRRSRVEAISGAAERAAELTRKLLAFSRRQVLRLEPLDIAAVVRGCDPILRPLLPETIAVEYDLEPGAVACVDRAELEQVLLNLSINARDAMPDGGRLTIAVSVVDGAVELVVADDGVGMTPETRSRIFDPFFTTKPVGQGTGLGLSTVDGIVAQLFGTVEVETEPGAGTTFRIRLPLATPTLLDEMPIVAAEHSPRRGGTVLLVEDEEVVRHVTTEMLRLTGYSVVAASNAEEALTMLRAGSRPDVLVSDVVMTGMDGPTLVSLARALLPDLPVLLVSGYPAETLGDRTTETVLSKPFTPAQLSEHVELVRRAPVPA